MFCHDREIMELRHQVKILAVLSLSFPLDFILLLLLIDLFFFQP